MPDFEITDRQTGESLTITADREPSQDDVAEIFASRPKAKAPADLSGVKLDPYEQARMAGTMPVQAGATTGPAHPEEVLTIPKSLMEPPVSIPRIEGKTVPGKIGAGLVNVAGGLFNMAASPVGLATLPMGGTEVGGAVLKGLFGGLMAKEAGRALGEASVTKDPQAITEAVAATALAPAIALPKLRPAVRTMDGKVVEGKAGETHNDIIKENELKPTEIDRREFVDQKGNELSREQAAAVTQLPTETEAGKLHSTDLPVQFAGTKATAPWPHGLVSKSPTGDGWRFTWFSEFKGELEPKGHTNYATRQEALDAAKEMDFDPVEPTTQPTKPPPSEPMLGPPGQGQIAQLKVGDRFLDSGREHLGEWQVTELTMDVSGKWPSLGVAKNLKTGQTMEISGLTNMRRVILAAKSPVAEPKGTEATTPPPTAVAGEEGISPGTVTAAPGTASQSAAPAGAEAAIRETKPEAKVLQESTPQLTPDEYAALSSAYSADKFPSIRPPFKRGGKMYTVGAVAGSKVGGYAEAYELTEVPKSTPTTKAKFVTDADRKRGYEGQIVSFRGKKYKLGPEQKFINPKTVSQPAATVIPQGPGAATLGDVPKEPQIVQLTKALQDVDSPRRPLGERARDMFNLSEHRSLAQTALGKALDGLKTTRDYLIKKWDGVKDWDDIKRVKGELSAEINERGWALRQFEKRARQAIPNRRDREAVASWLDNGGDEAKLRTALANAPERYKQSYRDALNLSPDLKINAEQVRSYFEARLTEAIDAGVLRDGIEDYIHRIYKRDTPVKDRILNQVQSGVLNTRSPRLAMQRVFEFDHEAEAAGYPIVKDFLPRLVDYEYSLARVIADRKAVKQFMAIRMPDGRPMIDVAGVGIPVENAQGVTEAMLVKPGFKRGDPNEPGAPSYRRDYLQRNDYPAFRRWKWVDTDPVTKRDVFVEGDVLVHKDAADRIDALMAKSAIRRSRLGSAALGASSVFKQTMLDFSGFHQVQIALHAAEHRVLPWNILKDIDLTNPKVQGLLKGGLNIGGDFHAFDYREGLVGHSLSRLIPGLGEVMQSYHEYLFRDFIPRVKTTMALHALERNRQRMPSLSEEQLNYLTAKQANAAFGELNYIVMERSKTVQDLARLVFLAPDFLEARGSFAAQTAQRLGKKGEWTNEQRTALFLGAVTMWVTARLANKLNDDQWHFEPENAFSLVHNGHTYSLRTVQGDLLHLWDKPFQFWLNRLNPVFGRSFLELGTGRDYYGRKRSRMELAWDLFANIRPIAFRSSQERKLWESVANSFGIQVKRWNDTDSAFKLAQQWKEKQGIGERGEFIYDAEKDPLRPLKLALTSNDDGLATTEIRKLLQSGYNRPRMVEYFRRYMRMPFTGSLANDAKWKRTLTEDQLQTVRTAQDHKQAVSKLFFNALRNYDAAKAGGR